MTKILKEKQIKQFSLKNPQWRKIFLHWLNEDEALDVHILESSFSVLLKNKKLLCQDVNINVVSSMLDEVDSTNRKVVERFHDKIHKTLNAKKKEQFLKSMKTKSYSHLFDEAVEAEIHTIIDNNISIKSMKKQFFNKIARYNTAEELLISLKTFKSKNIKWNKEYYLQKINQEDLNIKIESIGENSLLVQVLSHYACSRLGSQAWCIVEDEEIFDQYTDDLGRQFIYLDFDKDIEDNESLIGLTVAPNGDISDSYLKDDNITPEPIKEKFAFNQIEKNALKEFMSDMDNQDAFGQICRFGLDEYYDEYRSKDGVDPSKFNNTLIRNLMGVRITPIMSKLLNEKTINKDGYFSAKQALYSGNETEFKKYLKEGVNVEKYHNELLNFAIMGSRFNIVKELLKNKNVQNGGNLDHIVSKAVNYGTKEDVTYMIENIDKDFDETSYNRFFVSSINSGKMDIVKMFLSNKKVDPSYDNNWAFKASIIQRKYDITEELLKCESVDPTANNYDGLSVLINRGEIDIIEKILKDERVKASKNKKRIYEKILTFSRCTLKEKIKIKSMLEEHGFQHPNKRKPKIFKS